MNAGVTRQSLQFLRVVEQLTISLLPRSDLGRVVLARLIELANLRDSFLRFADGQREVGMIWNQLGEVVGFRRGEAERTTDILDGSARFQSSEGDDLTD